MNNKKNIAVLGAGKMGLGIAQLFASKGHQVKVIYVYDDNGYLLKNGWHKLDGVWYYTDAKGRAYTGERKINGTTYWFANDGIWVK